MSIVLRERQLIWLYPLHVLLTKVEHNRQAHHTEKADRPEARKNKITSLQKSANT